MKLTGLALAGLIATTVQAQNALLYTPKHQEISQQCAGAPAHNQVRSNEVEYVRPTVNQPYESEQFAPLQSYTTAIGDHDADGDYWAPHLFGRAPAVAGEPFSGIDALVRPRNQNGACHENARSVFISSSERVPHCLGAAFGWPVTPGDVFRVLPGGRAERFISEAQVRQAFGINDPVNVDAACFYWHPEPNQGGIYLSFEDTEMSAVLGVIQDGDLLWIPSASIAWGVSPYDACLVVQNVMAGSGQILRTEAQMDARVANANVSDETGAQVLQIVDLDGLTRDPQGGFVAAGHPHMWFSGEGLRGCSVLTTAGGGQIAVAGGVSLGAAPAAPTTGGHLELLPTKGTLDGLAVIDNDCHLTLDTTTPQCPAGCFPAIEVGGGVPGNPVWLLLDVAFDQCAPDPVAVAFPNCSYRELYPVAGFLGPIVIGADGCAVGTIALPGGFAGLHVRAQAVSLDAAGNPMLSTPLTIDL